jgi:hypothetical protein
LLLHVSTPAATKFLILSQPAGSYAGRRTDLSCAIGTGDCGALG